MPTENTIPLSDLPTVSPSDSDYIILSRGSDGKASKGVIPEITAASRVVGDQINNVLGQAQVDADKVIANIQNQSDAVLSGIGYLPPVPYAPNLTVNSNRFTVTYNNDVYAATGQLPFTTSASFEADKWRLIDGVKAVDLAGAAGAALVGFDGGTVQDVLDNAKPMADYTALRAYTGRATGVRVTQTGLAGFFQRDDADTTSADNGGTIIVASNGKRWKRQYVGPVHVKWFGTVGDGVADDIGPLQACADFALYFSGGAGIYIDPGQYSISRPWMLGYGVTYKGSPYVPVKVAGPGQSRLRGKDATIIPTFSNACAVVLQGVLFAELDGFNIVGKNGAYINGTVLTPHAPNTDIDQRVIANWIDPTLAATANAQYAPYGGVGIDPYCGPRPATSYPDVVYPAFLGAVEQYNKTQGSFFTLRNMYINGFVAGVVTGPSTARTQTDVLRIERCWLQANVWALSVCHTDHRVMHLDGCYVSDGYAAITNKRHGAQLGQVQSAMVNTTIDRCMKWLDIGDTAFARAGNITFTGCHGENIWHLGEYGGPSGSGTDATLTIQGCQVQFGWQQFDHIGKPAHELQTGTQGHLVLAGSTFTAYKRVFRIASPGDAVDVCKAQFYPYAQPVAIYEKVAHSASATVHMFPYGSPPVRPANFEAKVVAHYGFDGAETNSSKRHTRAAYSAGRNYPTCIHLQEFLAAEKLTPVPHNYVGVGKGSLANVALTGTTLTFDYTGRSADLFETYGPAPGDMLYDLTSGSVFYVRALTGVTVTAELQNNYSINGGVVNLINAFSLTVGTFYFITGRLYATHNALIGTLSTASAVLTDVGRMDGNSVYMGEVAVGDRLHVNESIDLYATVGANGNKISAIDTTARTITFGANLRRNLTKERLPFWVRPPLDNV